MSARSTAVILFVVAAILLPALATAQPVPPAPPAQTAFDKEWSEVVKKYPHVAHSYLMTIQAVNEGVRFANGIDAKAFDTSAFARLIRDVCGERQGDRLYLVQCHGVVVQPGNKCRRCGGACALPETAQECANCTQGNADNGCLP